MRLESNVHCGDVIVCRETAEGRLTTTLHAPGTVLLDHAHTKPHLAVLLEGAYFERIRDRCFLRLPGDEVAYPEGLVHENRFGRIPSQCLNIESDQLRAPRISSLPPEWKDLFDASVRSLRDVADRAGYHPVYFARTFRRAMGISVGDYIKTARIRRCAEKIFRSDAGLTEIALDSGFYDQSHLTNELRSIAGFTPGELRRFADA